MTTLFQSGDFTLNSGAKSTWKLECDALTPEDWAGLAQIALQLLGDWGCKFKEVRGVPRGGLPFAAALQPYCDPTAKVVLVVDDVLTTGGSLERFCDQVHQELGPETQVTGLCVFARGSCPFWVQTLFQMPEELWIKKTTFGPLSEEL